MRQGIGCSSFGVSLDERIAAPVPVADGEKRERGQGAKASAPAQPLAEEEAAGAWEAELREICRQGGQLSLDVGWGKKKNQGAGKKKKKEAEEATVARSSRRRLHGAPP